MPSAEARLAEAANEIKNLRGWMEEETKKHSSDHDRIVILEQQLKAAHERLDEQERVVNEHFEEGREEEKTAGSRRWEIWVVIIGALVAAFLGAVVTKLF